MDGGVHDPHRRVVPHRRIGVGEVRLHPDGRIPFIKFSIEHLLPELQVLIDGPVPAGTCLLLELQIPEAFGVAETDVSATDLDELFAPVVVDIEPITLVDDIGYTESQPLDIIKHHPVGFGINPPRVRVLDTEDIPASIPPDVVVVQDGCPGVPEVERSARVWRKPHHDATLRTLKGGELPLMFMGLGEFSEELRGDLFKEPLPFGAAQGRHLRGGLPRQWTDLADAVPELRVLPEHRADDRSALRGAVMLHRILQGVYEEQMLEISVHSPQKLRSIKKSAISASKRLSSESGRIESASFATVARLTAIALTSSMMPAFSSRVMTSAISSGVSSLR